MKIIILMLMVGFYGACECEHEGSQFDPICKEETLGESYIDDNLCYTCTYWDQPSDLPWTENLGEIWMAPEYKFDSAKPLTECANGVCSAEACNVTVK